MSTEGIFDDGARARQHKVFRVARPSCIHAVGGTLVLTLLLVAGCETSRMTAEVDGLVTLDGRPLDNVRVTFQPQSTGTRETGMGSHGITNSQGYFVLRLADDLAAGAVVGRHQVTLSDKMCEDDVDAGASNTPKSRIPSRYSESPFLVFEVKPGLKNKALFKLSSR